MNIRVNYISNNSGGDWWLEDHDWFNLEEAGWEVDWVADDKEVLLLDVDGRWLGALAKRATKEFGSIDQAISEFESITGQDVSDEGCNCCGAPHSFDWDSRWCSGEDCLEYMYSELDTSLTKRELLEKLNRN